MSDQCTNKAEWWLTEGPGPDQYTVSCTEHLSGMVSDQTANIAAADLDEPCCYVGQPCPDRLTDGRLAELDEMERAATPGPWKANTKEIVQLVLLPDYPDAPPGNYPGSFDVCPAYDCNLHDHPCPNGFARAEDAALTVAARNALRPLLDKVREARRKIPILEGRAVEYLSAEDEKGRRIAELERDREAREAQLAEMRRAIEALESPCVDVFDDPLDDVTAILDCYAIPTTPPEEEEDA